MFCPHCGKPNADNAVVCEACNKPMRMPPPSTTATPVPSAAKKTSPLKVVLIVIAVIFGLAVLNRIFKSDDNLETNPGADTPSVTGQAEETVSTESGGPDSGVVFAEKADTQEAVQNDGVIGDYVVTIKGAKVVKSTYNNEDILVVTYSYTNNSDKPKAFSYSVSPTAFQNGVEIKEVWTKYGIEDEYDFDNQSKEIQPGITLDVQEAYKLSDTTSTVTVEVTEWITLKDDKLTYTIELTD